MSHFSKVDTQINDLKALEDAAKKMGFSMERNSDCRYYYGSERKDIVIKLPTRYDVSVERNSSGTYSLNADFFGGYVASCIGRNGNSLLQQYAVEKVKTEAKKKGYSVVQKEKCKLKITDTKTGGQVNVEFDEEGKATFNASGFKGKSCMNFESIEKALGTVTDHKKKSEYYQKETVKTYQKESRY